MPDPATALVQWLMAGPDAHDLPTLEVILNRPKWHQQAACRGVGPVGFVTGRGGTYSHRHLCDECPVRTECLEVALADDSLRGLWGGTTDAERREMRRGRAVA